jgi:hypothetical protein
VSEDGNHGIPEEERKYEMEDILLTAHSSYRNIWQSETSLWREREDGRSTAVLRELA